MPNSAAEFPRVAGPLQAISLLLPITMSVIGVVVLLPVVPAMAEHFRNVPGVAFWVPVLLTTPSLVIVLLAPIAGLLADRFGRRNILLAAMLIYALAGVAPFLIGGLYELLGSRVIVGMCEAIVLTITTTMIGDYFKGAECDKWLGHQTAVASLSATVLIFAGGVLGGIFGWNGPFLIYGIALILAVAVACLPGSRCRT